MQEPSIFTKIIRGEAPCYKIYEDDKTLAFLDIYAVVDGHTLVVPKKQVEFLWDLDDEEYRAVMATAKKVARHLRETMNIPYVGVKVVGTDVPHAHVHLIPFESPGAYEKAGMENTEPDHDTLAAIAAKLAF